MPRTLTLHLASLLAGAALTAVVLLSMSQSPSQAPMPLRVEYLPHPRDMVQIQEGLPFTVPAGRIFSLTALGTPGAGTVTTQLKVNGQVQLSAIAVWNQTSASSMTQVPSGFSVAAGDVIEPIGQVGSGRAWGYLANQ